MGSDIAAIITAVGFLITACTGAAALIQTTRNGRVLKDVKAQTDGLTSALVEAKSQVAAAESKAVGLTEGHALGIEQGRHEERK